jgi:hypothetical protein
MLKPRGETFNLFVDAFTDLLHILTLFCFELNSGFDYWRRERRHFAGSPEGEGGL